MKSFMNRMKRQFSVLALSLFSSPVFAQGVPGIGQMFANFASASVALTKLTAFISFFAGVYFLILALVKLKAYAESGGRDVKPSTILMIFLVSILMIVYPTTINITTHTLALGDNAGSLMSTAGTGGQDVNSAINGVILFIQLVGHIGFLRGLFMLKSVGEGSRDATIGRALIFLVAGAFAINLRITVAIFGATLAPGMSLPGF